MIHCPVAWPFNGHRPAPSRCRRPGSREGLCRHSLLCAIEGAKPHPKTREHVFRPSNYFLIGISVQGSIPGSVASMSMMLKGLAKKSQLPEAGLLCQGLGGPITPFPDNMQNWALVSQPVLDPSCNTRYGIQHNPLRTSSGYFPVARVSV